MAAIRLLSAAGVVAALGTTLALTTPASAQVYWSNQGTDSIGRAALDGSGADGDFVAGAADPTGVAIDGEFVYWSHAGDPDPEGAIGRADVADGGAPNHDFVTTPAAAAPPGGVAVDNSWIYWTGETIGRAGLDGAPVSPAFINSANTGTSACGIASDADEIVWGVGPAASGALRAAHGPFAPNPNFLPGQDDPCGVARARGFVFWTERGADDGIGRADFDSTNADPGFVDVADGSDPCGVAVDEGHVYWTNRTTETIQRAPFTDLTDVETIVPASAEVDDPCGIAVSPTAEVAPSAHDFGAAETGDVSQIQAFLVANTGSSVLDVTELSLSGPNPGDFEITGDACSLGSTPAGNGCIVNVRFAPTASGEREAVLTVTANASDSPVTIGLSGDATNPAPPAPPGQGATPDADAPQILAADVRPARFAVRPNGPPEVPVARAKKGTRFTYSLSEAALLVIAIERRSDGALKRIGSFAQQSQAGAGEKSFSGWIGQRRLRPGRHLATLFAIDAAGNFSAPAKLGFRVLDAGR
jgi:hypothetical protein